METLQANSTINSPRNPKETDLHKTIRENYNQGFL
jgi:hypothetical protein